jgi:glycine cleavage system H protein
MKIDSNLLYSSEHLWVNSIEQGEYLSGITDYAQDLLGDIVFVEFPEIGAILFAGKPCGLVESVKTGSDLHAPLDGVVTEINESLQVKPEQINDLPYKTWIFKFKPNNPDDLKNLLDAKSYETLVSSSS